MKVKVWHKFNNIISVIHNTNLEELKEDYKLSHPDFNSRQREIDIQNIQPSDNDELIMIGSGRRKTQEEYKEDSNMDSKFLHQS